METLCCGKARSPWEEAIQPFFRSNTAAPASPRKPWVRVRSASWNWGGAAVFDLKNGWIASSQGDRAFPQQSVSKLWVAVDGHHLVQVDATVIDLVEQSHRDPELGDALLRKGAIALGGGDPAVLQVEHRRAGVAAEALGQGPQRLLELGRRGRVSGHRRGHGSDRRRRSRGLHGRPPGPRLDQPETEEHAETGEQGDRSGDKGSGTKHGEVQTHGPRRVERRFGRNRGCSFG